MPPQHWLRTIATTPMFWLLLVFLTVSASAVYFIAAELRHQLHLAEWSDGLHLHARDPSNGTEGPANSGTMDGGTAMAEHLPGEVGQSIILLEVIALAAIGLVTAIILTYVLIKQTQKAVSRSTRLAMREKAKNRKLSEAIAHAELMEARSTAIIETMDSGLIRFALNGSIEMANAAAVQMLRAGSEQELLGRSVAEFVPEAAAFGSDFGGIAIAQEGQCVRVRDRVERQGLRCDGSIFPIEVTVTDINVRGTHAFTVVFRDLSAQKIAAAKVKQAETRLVDAIESLPDAFVLYDADDRLVICNSKYRDFYSTSAEFIKEGARFEDIIRKGAEAGQYSCEPETIESWIEERLKQHQEPGDALEQQLDDGRWIRVIERRTSEGGLVGFRVDITELKRREQEIKRSGDLLRNVVAASFDGVIVMDAEGVVIDYNPAAEEIFGWSHEEIIGRPMSTYIIPERHRSGHYNGLQKFLQTGIGPVIGQRIEVEALHKNGNEIFVELAIRNTVTEDGPLFVGYIRDITEQRAAEAALREAKERAEIANEAKAKFLAMMSHEIRTPLNGVLGILSLLRSTSLDKKQLDYVQTARESGKALLSLINDILDFTKLEAGRMELDASAFDLRAVADGVVNLFVPAARDKGITLNLEYPPATPHQVIGDPGRLRQIILNLVSNAVKFTEFGGVTLSVSGEKSSGKTADFKIMIRDTGIGIPEDKHEALFGNFVTVDTSYSRKFGGSGLGLAICDQLVQLMGGTIGFDSKPGIGSCFWVKLSLQLADTAHVATPTSPRNAPDRLPENIRILLAEDNPTNQIVVGHLLENAGCNADLVSNGEEAVIAARTTVYDCILMDVSMPHMDGIEATEHIRRDSLNQATPIIALTAYALKGDRERFLSSGMDEVLPKPFEQSELIFAIMRSTSLSAPDGHSAQDTSTSPVEGPSAAEKIMASMPVEIRDKLIAQFAIDISQRADAVRSAHESADMQALERATHAMKSIAGTFGAEDLAEKADLINSLVREERHEEAMSFVPQLIETAECALTLASQLASRLQDEARIAT
ncbi:PAS domain S-box protein [Roseibium sp.]|uniref:PAS domain S-box protein n=1 Tax=Roseibium sp. TaxID=1936156 RepID=UPI003A97985D